MSLDPSPSPYEPHELKIKKPLSGTSKGIKYNFNWMLHNLWYFRYKTAAALCDNDLIFALSINAEEEIGYSERSANWAKINALVEDDAHEKRKLIFSPGVSQGPGQWLTFQMLFQFTIMINKDVFLALRNHITNI